MKCGWGTIRCLTHPRETSTPLRCSFVAWIAFLGRYAAILPAVDATRELLAQLLIESPIGLFELVLHAELLLQQTTR